MHRSAVTTCSFAVCCVLSLAHCALAANPTWTLHPDDTEQLKKWGVQVSYQLLTNDFENPEYAFTITLSVPKGLDGLDAMMSIYNSRGLVARQSWSDTDGKCTAFFTIGKQTLNDAGFMVQLYRGKRTQAFSASGRYVFSLAEFAADERYCSGRAGVTAPPKTTEIRLFQRSQRNGPWLTVEITPKDVLGNHEYDLHVVVENRSDEHYQLRNGQPITKNDVLLADINSDGVLDILIAGGVDHRGQNWYKTMIYEDRTRRYRWIADEPNSPNERKKDAEPKSDADESRRRK